MIFYAELRHQTWLVLLLLLLERLLVLLLTARHRLLLKPAHVCGELELRQPYHIYIIYVCVCIYGTLQFHVQVLLNELVTDE